MKAGIKYCGGCNPSYDRIAAAEKIIDKIKREAEFVSYKDSDVDLVVVIMGCSAACADLDGLNMEKVKIINSENDADSIIF